MDAVDSIHIHTQRAERGSISYYLLYMYDRGRSYINVLEDSLGKKKYFIAEGPA